MKLKSKSLMILLGFACLGAIGCSGSKDTVVEATSPNIVARPVAQSYEYAGSESCRECHGKIVDQYESSPKRRASGEITEAHREDRFLGTFTTEKGWAYVAESTADSLVHGERLENDLETVYTDQHVVTHFIGSGKHATNFLIRREKQFYLSPIQASPGGTCELVHEYQTVNQHFVKPLDAQCMSCHIGNVQPKDERKETSVEEFGISCEKCHGPAVQHVNYRRTNPKGSRESDPITSLAKLDAQQRIDQCAQCHLWDAEIELRYGRNEFDFRPGDRLSDVRVPFLPTNLVSESVTSQVTQLRKSLCFIESQGKLVCTTCHDPHKATASADGYREQCITCHHASTQECPLPKSEQGNCISCHMPSLAPAKATHITRTQHQIRRPGVRPEQNVVEFAFEPEAEAVKLVPAVEMLRAQNLMLGRYARQELDILAAFTASRNLRSLQPQFPDDEPMWLEMSSLYRMTNDEKDAYALLARLFNKSPKHLSASRELILIAYETDVFDIGVKTGKEYLARNPWDNEITGCVVAMLGRSNRAAESIQLAEEAMTRFPWDHQYPTWLCDRYRELGNQEKAEKFQRLAEQLTR